MDTFSCTWTVKFSTRESDNNVTTLPNPPSFTSEAMKWNLQANLTDEKFKDYVSIFLILASSNEEEVWATFAFSILNDNEQKKRSIKSEKRRRFFQGQDWGFHRFIKKDFLLDGSNGFIANDQFTIVCEVTVFQKWSLKKFCPSLIKIKRDIVLRFPNNLRFPRQMNVLSGSGNKESVLHDFFLMFKNKKMTDVTIVVQDQEFKAHKMILAARSPVFLAMFQHEMQESKINQVDVTDIDPEVFEEMIHYIYTGKSAHLWKMAEHLLVAADKYQLATLKDMCSEKLCRSLAIDNVANILVLADRHNVTELKARALDFISCHAKGVMKTENFKSMTLSYPNLLAEAFRALAMKIVQKDPLIYESPSTRYTGGYQYEYYE